MKYKLNVAVIGAGLFGQVHLHAYSQHPRANLAKVCEVNEERAAEAKKKFGAETCSDYREIADDDSIDAVSVVTPDFLHREIVIALAEAGKHVLVEKPLATKICEAREIVQAVRKAGTSLMVDFQNRWGPAFVEAKQRIDNGEFGEPVMANMHLANTLFVPRQMLSWAAGSGPHWFLFPHIVDMVCWLFNREARRVTASGHKGVLQSMGIDTFDSVQALVEFDDCSATFQTTWIIPESHPAVVDYNGMMFGTKGRMAFSPAGPVFTMSGGEKFETPVLGAMGESHGKMAGWQMLPVEHFVDSLLAGKEPMCTPEEGFHNTAIVRAVEKSIDGGKTVEVEKLEGSGC